MRMLLRNVSFGNVVEYIWDPRIYLYLDAYVYSGLRCRMVFATTGDINMYSKKPNQVMLKRISGSCLSPCVAELQ